MWQQFLDLTKENLKLRNYFMNKLTGRAKEENQNSDFITKQNTAWIWWFEFCEENLVYNEMWASIGRNQMRFHKLEKKRKDLTQFSTNSEEIMAEKIMRMNVNVCVCVCACFWLAISRRNTIVSFTRPMLANGFACVYVKV